MNENERLGIKIKNIRKNKGLTQELLAEKSDLSTRQIVKIENGQATPTIQTLQSIAKALDVSFNNLFDNDSYDSISIVRSKARALLDSLNDDNLRLFYRILKSIT